MRSYDGATVEEAYMPSASKLIRSGEVKVNVTPATNTNIFTAAGLDADKIRMNRRYTLMTSLDITETDAVPATHDYTVAVSFRPDNRSQFVGEATFTDSTTATVTISINGHVNYEKGIINFNTIFAGGGAGSTFVCNYAEFTLRFSPFATMNGRTKVTVSKEMTDVTIDQNEDFILELTEEEVQDYNSIFKVDLLMTISEAIKRQIMLNKDYDLGISRLTLKGVLNNSLNSGNLFL